MGAPRVYWVASIEAGLRFYDGRALAWEVGRDAVAVLALAADALAAARAGRSLELTGPEGARLTIEGQRWILALARDCADLGFRWA